MNRREYVQKIQNILKQIENGDFEFAENELQRVKNIYPRSLGYNVCIEKKNFMSSKEYYNPYEKLEGKIYFLNDYPFVSETMKLYQDAAVDEWGEDCYSNALKIIRYDDSAYYAVDNICASIMDENDNFIVCKELYDVLDAYAYVIHRIAINKKYPALIHRIDFKHIYTRCNMQMFLEDLEKHFPMILIETEDYCKVSQVLLQDLIYLKQPVCYVRQPNKISEVRLDSAWDKTLSSIEKKDGIIYITPVTIDFSDGYSANNVDDVLQYVKNEIFQVDLIGVLGEMQYLERLSVTPSLRKNFYKITTGMMSRSYRCLNYALYGDYLSYIGKIYDEDVRTLIQQPTKTKFSIIIPARNSAETLRYTLQTCLNQTFQGEYEIIVSDNSTGQNASVYELCKELNDKRIVYLKTPRDLHLPKSFEFAYTHAKGEYIFSIGSDDGLLPWALEELDKIVNAYPDEEIIQWERGFYAWPGFNGGQENQLEVPRAYSREGYEIFYKDGVDYIAEVIIRPEAMYSLPMLYINSCFKREYFQTLLNKTGRLWDGVCQDIYMGVVTAVINPKILNMRFPLSIAGMSNGSVGATANKGIHTSEEFKKLQAQRTMDGNVGGYYETYYERLCPSTGTDTYSLYKTILRMISIGLLPELYLDQVIPWKDWYVRLAAELDIMDVSFDAKIHEMRYCASLLGDEFLDWFDRGIYAVKTTPQIVDEHCLPNEKKTKTYEEGKNKLGGVTLDASRHGVTNIYEAVALFTKIMEEGVDKYF